VYGLGDRRMYLPGECWLVAMVKVVMGMAIGTACMACWLAGETLVLSGMTGATSGLH